MNVKEQKKVLEKGIENFKDYIKNADHSQPSSFDLIFADGLSDDESEYIFAVVNRFESFKPILNNNVLIEDQLNEMLLDLNSLV